MLAWMCIAPPVSAMQVMAGRYFYRKRRVNLVIQDLPAGMTIQELGEHRLKDMKYPTSIYQLVIEGLPAEFPAAAHKIHRHRSTHTG